MSAKKTKQIKRAVLIGINYKNTAYQLEGCTNDMCAIYKLISGPRFGYEPQDIRYLTDVPDEVNLSEPEKVSFHKSPTKANIIESLQWLLKGVKKGDQLLLFASCHGKQVECLDNTESDNRNEAILCVDNQLLLDNELWKILISKVSQGVGLSLIFDCCHSGSLADLQYCFMFAPYTTNIFSMSIEKSLEIKGNVCSFSACYDKEESGDSLFDSLGNGQKMGCFTYYFIEAINETDKSIECDDFLKAVSDKLDCNGYCQRPQYSCSKAQMFTSKLPL